MVCNQFWWEVDYHSYFPFLYYIKDFPVLRLFLFICFIYVYLFVLSIYVLPHSLEAFVYQYRVWMRNVPYRFKYLNTWSLVCGTLWGHCRTFRDGALLEEEHHWRQALGGRSPTSIPFSFLGCLLMVPDVNYQLPDLAICCQVFPAMRDSPSRTISASNLFLL